ncbi:MAG TPA: cupin domain-containing protein [Gaiellaceae bacterium]|nr:cupin domain-containing protein [Gaiellaceae bacterium]
MDRPVVNLSELDSRRVELGHLCADWTFAGPAVGCLDVGFRRLRIEPGFFSTPLHVHADDEETFFVLAGSGVSVQDDKTYAVRPGDCIVHAEAKEAHTLRAGDDGLDVLVWGLSQERTSGARLPRVGISWTARSWFETGAGKSPFEREAELGPPDVPELSDRPGSIVNVDAVEPELTQREKHRSARRPLAARAGAKRTGLNHIVLEPGQMGAPPHCHGAEEEVFVMLAGDGTLLLGGDEHPVKLFDVVARPAGTRVAHAFTAGANGLTFLAYGPRNPNDIVYYPRSNKIAFFGVGVIGRIEPLDYWDGED